jgi:hypothetical protein
MHSLRRRIPVDALLLALLCAVATGVHAANRALEHRVRELRPTGDVGPLPDGSVVRVLSLGFDRLMADLFWVRTIYYVGDDASERAGYPAIERLANLVTDIDPQFTSAYALMGSALSGLRGDVEAAIAFLEKGIANVKYWKLHYQLGFIYFVEKQDYPSAARQIEIASTLGGPPYLPLFASRLYANSGDPATAAALIQERLRQEPPGEARDALEKRYWDLWINRDLERIDAASAKYRERKGRWPSLVSELVQEKLLQQEPLDPRAGHYRIEAGRARTDLPYDKLQLHQPERPRISVDQQFEQFRRENGEVP